MFMITPGLLGQVLEMGLDSSQDVTLIVAEHEEGTPRFIGARDYQVDAFEHVNHAVGLAAIEVIDDEEEFAVAHRLAVELELAGEFRQKTKLPGLVFDCEQ